MTHDNVNSPSHYTNGGIEVIDILKAKMDRKAFEGYLEGNVLKYMFRFRHKNGSEDLKKASWYLNVLINEYKKD